MGQKSKKFSSLQFTVTSANRFYSPLPLEQTEAEFLEIIGSSEFSSLLFTVTSNNELSPPVFYSLLPLSKSGLKLVCKVNIVYRNHKSQNSQDYAQKPQRNCTFMNSVSGATYVSTYLPKSLIPTQHLYASIPYIRST